MAQYKVLQKSFINNKICEEGEIVELDDQHDTADNLERLTSKTKKPVNADEV